MSAIIIDGKKIADESNLEVKNLVEIFTAKKGRVPSIKLLLVGENPDSKKYVKSKIKLATSLGIDAQELVFENNVPEDELFTVIQGLNDDIGVDAILVQLPLPKHLDSELILSSIDIDKDVDGLHPELIGKLVLDSEDYFQVPCTPLGVLRLILEAQSELTGDTDISGLNAVVIGRSNLVGKPTAILLQREDVTVTQCHRYSRNIAEFTKLADIIVSATGVPSLIRGEILKPGAIVIDVGITYSEEEGKLLGDCDFESCKEVAGAITPVPGGVGPMTMAMLMRNILFCAENNN